MVNVFVIQRNTLKNTIYINRFVIYVQSVVYAVNLVVWVVFNQLILLLLKIIVFANLLKSSLKVIAYVEILTMMFVNVNLNIIHKLIMLIIVDYVKYVHLVVNVIKMGADNVIQ
jgi:hypothetical protein